MKIEVGKTYLMRCGAKARVVCIDAATDRPIVAVHPEGEAYNHRADGGFFKRPVERSEWDLVSEYVEPPKPREVWVRVGRNKDYAECAWGESEIGRVRETDPDLFAKLVKFREVIE